MADIVCPDCGDVHKHFDEPAPAVIEVAELTSAEVEIARINADKEIKLAKIQAGIVSDELVVEAAVDAAHAQGEADGLREAIAPPEPEPEPEPVVIVDDAPPEPEVPEPPDAGKPEHHEPRKRGMGMW